MQYKKKDELSQTQVNELQKQDRLVIHYNTVRNAIGWLGIGLPIVLLAGLIIIEGCDIQDSISDYYHTIMRDIFVGILCAVAFFFFTYKGYDIYDRVSTRIAAVFALGIAFFPTPAHLQESCVLTSYALPDWVGYVHFGSAICFFLTLTFISIFLFTKTNDEQETVAIKRIFHTPDKRKKQNNLIYVICGLVMFICLIIIALFKLYLSPRGILADVDLIFWMEFIALFAFGISWVVKGESLPATLFKR